MLTRQYPNLNELRQRYDGIEMRVEELLEAARQLVPEFRSCFVEPDQGRDASPLSAPLPAEAADIPNERLLRHYVAENLLSPPEKLGRENRYTLRHLLELLALRRLQHDGGLTQSGMRNLLPRCSEEDLFGVLVHGLQPHSLALAVAAERGNPRALQAIESIYGELEASQMPPWQSLATRLGRETESFSSWWDRDLVWPGLELMFSENFVRPSSLAEEDELLQRIRQRIRRQQHRRRSDR